MLFFPVGDATSFARRNRRKSPVRKVSLRALSHPIPSNLFPSYLIPFQKVRKRRVRSRYPGQGVPRAGATSGMRGSAGVATGVGGGGGGATTTGASPGDGEEAAEFVYKVTERGEGRGGEGR